MGAISVSRCERRAIYLGSRANLGDGLSLRPFLPSTLVADFGVCLPFLPFGQLCGVALTLSEGWSFPVVYPLPFLILEQARRREGLLLTSTSFLGDLTRRLVESGFVATRRTICSVIPSLLQDPHPVV